MKLYECNFCNDTKTTFITDDFFNPVNEYTGIAFRGSFSYLTKVGSKLRLVMPIIIAGNERESDYYWYDYSGYCTMTELKAFLCRTDNSLDVNNNPEGLGWIKEISNALSKIEDENTNQYRRFSKKYKLHAQGKNEFQTYGRNWKDLVLEGFFLECIPPVMGM